MLKTLAMSDLTHIERIKLEKLFGMGGGYVLRFGDRTFRDFMFESTGKDIDDDKYRDGGNSKANRLRSFWTQEPNYIVAQSIFGLLNTYHADYKEYLVEVDETDLCNTVRLIAERLKSDLGEHIEAIQATTDDIAFDKLAKAVKTLIEANKPDEAIDRLHTFMVKYIRAYCDKHGVVYDKEKSLNALYGEYVKKMKALGFIESEMSERILRYATNVLEAFNGVRNNQSLAHANPILNHHESLLIFKNIASLVAFIDAVEGNSSQDVSSGQPLTELEDLPF